MPRTARVVAPGFPHHVVFRGNNRRRLFSYPRDYLAILRILQRLLREHRVSLAAMTLMSNHGHLIITPHSEVALSALMKGVLQRYAQQRNREKGCSGKLFEQRFWSTPIVESGHLAATTAYVELNPERAGLGSSERYRWTTYRLHAGQGDATFARLWTPSTWYLGLGSDREARARAYRAWVERARGSACVAPDVIRDPPVPAGAPRVERPDRSGAR